ncbi:MAG: hypothetical protein M3Z67_09595 [Commensalibacter sp.]|nr:hypothetical protein [Commensalibacter sp.]
MIHLTQKSWRKILGLGALFSMGMIAATGVQAQGWEPNCGGEPKAPAINVSSVENYNASVDRFKAYEKAARTYYACVVKQSNQKQAVISQKAKSEMEVYQKVSVEVHNRISGNFNKIDTELKTAAKKLKAASKN